MDFMTPRPHKLLPVKSKQLVLPHTERSRGVLHQFDLQFVTVTVTAEVEAEGTEME